MCVMCVAIPFVLVTIAPRFITAAEVNLFFLLETILGPIWVWMVIKEQPSNDYLWRYNYHSHDSNSFFTGHKKNTNQNYAARIVKI